MTGTNPEQIEIKLHAENNFLTCKFNNNKENLLRCHRIQIRKPVFYHFDHVYVDV